MSNPLRNFKVWAPLALSVVFALGMWIGYRIATSVNNAGPAAKLNEIMRLVDERYVDEIDTDSLLESSIADIMSKLDPHSVYISAQDLAAVNSELEGSFSGIGISFNMLKDTVVVLEVITGGPSERVGLQAGDRIITIDDSIAAGQKWSTEKVISLLRGEKDTMVKVGVRRQSSPELLEFEIKRGDIPVNTVDASYMADETTGYIRVNKFGRTTMSEFITALATLRAEGASDYIIDLRGNGGGFMEMAVLMANEFLPDKSLIVSTRGRNFDDDSAIYSDGTGSFQSAGVAVLLDEYSASASEIFAGAIQDNDRGLVIGRRSFGKGLVQQQYPLSDSSAVRLTVSRYYTPSGRCIQKTFTRGADATDYELDLLNRFNHGEAYHADSIRLDTTVTFYTVGGRPVYGGGGIMPDVFVPNDTTGITTYYLEVSNKGLIQKYAFDYFEANRERLKESRDLDDLLTKLPTDTEMLRAFSAYAASNGVPTPFWKTINQSRQPIVRNIKAAIARDVLGTGASFEVFNAQDKTIQRALDLLRDQREND